MSARPTLDVAVLEPLLRELLTAINGLRADLALTPFRVNANGHGFDAELVELLRCIDLFAEGRQFSAWELCDRATLPDAAELRRAIVAACGSLSPRKVGKWLKRCEGTGTVERVGVDRDGIVWRVSRV